MEAIITLIAGGIVTYSLVLRYQTINTPEFTENTRVTIGVFFAFAVGLIMLDPKKSEQIPNAIGNHWLIIFFSVSPLFIIPIFQVLKGNHLSYAFRKFNFDGFLDAISWVLGHSIAIFIIGYILILIYDKSGFGVRNSIDNSFYWILPNIFFISFFVFLGFIHSLFGTVIAGINIAMVLAHFFIENAFGGSLGMVFDFFEMVGISSTPIKWGIMVLSTALGIHSWISFDDMRDAVNNLIS